MLQSKRKIGVDIVSIALCAGVMFLFVFCYASQASAETPNSCVACHSDANFSIFNKKIRNYFIKWENSNHAAAGVTCYDCHGGNPEQTDMNNAHAGKNYSIYSNDIPQKCGKCHNTIYDSFKKSYHYKYLKNPKIPNMTGVNCITCHSQVDSFMGMAPNPEVVKKACELCHNYKSETSPEIPQKVVEILVRFNTIKQQFNDLIMRTEGTPSQDFIKASRQNLEDIFAAWHSFNLQLAGEKTDEALAMLKEERKILRKIHSERIYEKEDTPPLYGN